MVVARPPQPDRRRRPEAHRGPWVVVGLLVVVVWAGLLSVAQRHPLVADSVGYVTAGQRLADGDGLAWRDAVNEVAGPFSSPMAYPVRRGDADELRFGYPAGFPVAIAAAVEATGRPGAATLVAPVLGGLVVAATAALAWTTTRSRWLALGAAGLAATIPDLWRFGADAWADIPATVLAAGGVAAVAAVAAAERTTSPRRGVVLAGAAGILLAALCWVRPAGLVLVVAVVAVSAPGWLGRRRPTAPALALAAPLAAGLLGLAWFQARWFGSPVATGYAVEHGWYPHPAFRLRYAFGASFVDGHSVPAALATAWHDLGPLVLVVPIGLAALGRRDGLLVGGALAGCVAPYLVYAFAPTDENARFLLPAVPFAAVAAVVGVRALAARVPRPAVVTALAAGCVALLLVPRAAGARAEAGDAAGAAERRVAEARAIAARTPADAVLVSYEWNDALAVYGDRSVLNVRRIPPGDVAQARYRTDLLPGCLDAAVAALRAAGRPVAVVEGATPPALDPLPVLRQRFTLEPRGADPVIWMVGDRRPGVPPGSVEPCREAAVDG